MLTIRTPEQELWATVEKCANACVREDDSLAECVRCVQTLPHVQCAQRRSSILCTNETYSDRHSVEYERGCDWQSCRNVLLSTCDSFARNEKCLRALSTFIIVRHPLLCQ